MHAVLRTALGAVFMLAVAPAAAQSYPAKPVRVLVGFSPGSTTDLVARVLVGKMGEGLNQQVIVENRPGANANIAAELVAKAAADGYTLHFANAGIATGAAAYQKLQFNALRDFAPVAQASATPHIVTSHPSLPPRTIRDLVTFARARPGELNYASTGHGNSDHLAAELFCAMTGLKMVHVSYKGGPQALADVAAGQIAMYFSGLPSALPFVKTGKVRAIAVTGSRRSDVLPDVPTVAESGVPGYEHVLWGMLLAPAGTPREIVARLNKEVHRVLALPEVRERYAGMGVEPAPSSPEQAAAYLKSETEKYAKVIQAIGLRLD